MKSIVVIVALLCCARNLQGQSGDPTCMLQTTCFTCMEAGPNCVWCTEPVEVGTVRCNTIEGFGKTCDSRYIGDRSAIDIIKEDPLKDVGEDANEKAVQIKPQIVKLKLRTHESQNFTMVYRPARNYPLDLYYLMDLSWSMRDDKETLITLRDRLPEALRGLTKHARIAFGSFADKLVMPFASMKDRVLENPCLIDRGACAPLYEYKHQLPLTNNFQDFITTVNNSEVTGNIDNLEGGLDALVQAIVCRDQVGWMDDSRKIIIYASDGTMHFAGDGKLGGIIKPNDCSTCYLDETGTYNRFKEIDYPSLSGISRALTDKKIFVIFAVTDEVTNEYNKLQELIKENTFVARISEDSSNILQLVKEGYEHAVSSANFKDDASSYLSVKYFTNCGKKDGVLLPRSNCDDVQVGKEYEFLVKVTLEKCPEDKAQWQNLLKIEERLTAAHVKVELEYLCGCPCEDQEQIQQNHEKCNGHGDLKCGQCYCGNGWSGRSCDCDLKDAQSEKILEQQCVQPKQESSSDNNNSTEDLDWLEIDQFHKENMKAISLDTPDNKHLNLTWGASLCSGNGECSCGVCICLEGYSGTYCNCGTCAKNKDQEEICGGPSQGRCDCGKCRCTANWTGEYCDCPVSDEACATPGTDGDYCSGNGECLCGKCICEHDMLGRECTGDFCQICGETNEICDNFLECARCYAESADRRDKGEMCTQECHKHKDNEILPKMVDNLEESDANTKCAFQTELNDKTCHHEYVYRTRKDEKKLDLHVTSECRTKTSTAAVGLYIIIGTLLIGLLGLLLFKLYQKRKEKIEFMNFANEADLTLKEMAHSSQVESPLYKSPITHHEMPAEAFRRVPKVDCGNPDFLIKEETEPCEGCRTSTITYSIIYCHNSTPPSSPMTKEMNAFESLREVKE